MSSPLLTPLTRRRLLQLVGAAGVGAAAAACGGGPGGSSAPSRTAAPASAGPVTGQVSFAHWRAEDKTVFDTVLADFAKAHPGVSVRQDITPSNDYQSNALQKIKTGATGDAFTAFRGAQFVSMAKAGLFAPLDGSAAVGGYQPALITAGQSEGKQLGLPYQLVFPLPIVNTALLEKAGVSEAPKDWDGFLALCEKLKGLGVVPIAWPGGDAGNAGQLLNPMVMNNAPADDMFTQVEKGTLKVTDDWFVTTLRQYAQLRPYVQAGASGTAVEPAQQLFASGKAAMLATGSFHLGAVRKLGATFPVDLISPITVAADKAKYEGSFNATFILGVSTASKNQAAAAALVDFLSRPEVATTYANGTVQHLTVKGVDYSNADLKATAPWLTKKTLLAPRFQFTKLDVRSAVESATVKVVAGTDPAKAAADAQRVVDQQR